ncbi:hypothetical protein [Flavobacterium sp. N1736]|uniref:hypothetical protein n=1 Tax=Flavobacterium sp. N1736 TaxID=2986823 RepID=UPI002225A7C9|nr:hypothetical protein [Flavobacterium sp. N1736]
MIKNLKQGSTILLLFVLFIFSSTLTAQPPEGGEVPFDFHGLNELDNLDIPPKNEHEAPPDFAYDYDWDNLGKDSTPHSDNPNNDENTNYPTNPGQASSGGGFSNAVNRQTSSLITLTKAVKPGQTHTQAVKVLRDTSNSANKYVSNLVINGVVVGTITFSDPQKDENGIDIYTKLTVEVFSNSPIAIASLSPQDAETSEYEGSQHSTDGNLKTVMANVVFVDNIMKIEFVLPVNDNEDLIIGGMDMPVDTPQSYENALNAVSNGDYIITNGVVKIKADKGNIYTLVSEADVNSPSVLQRVKNLAAIIAKSLGGSGKDILINVEKGDVLSSKNPAWTRKVSTIIFNSNGGLSPFLNNINNFKSVIKHEIFHVEDNRKSGFKTDISTHADVYVKAANDYTFNNTTDDFKKDIAGSFAKYLLNMATDANISLSDILAKIDSFNKNNAGVQILKPIGIITKANLSLRVQYKNVISDSIKYEKIDV